MNGFFKRTDPATRQIGGMQLPPDWWSRHYEYIWALQFTGTDLSAADMGTGRAYRPFGVALADTCQAVDAYDIGAEVLAYNGLRPNLTYYQQDITAPFDRQYGRVFCISVLEDLPLEPTLRAFKSALKPGGLIVLTCDVQYDDNLPLGKYPGVGLERFEALLPEIGLRYVGPASHDKTDAVYHAGFNLCCYHCVLEAD